MADYAAVPVQVVAQALLIIDAGGNPQLVDQRGFFGVTRGTSAHGDFILQFDHQNPLDPVSIGLPGTEALDPRRARVNVTNRGNGASPPTSRIAGHNSSFVMTPGEGATAVEITTVDVAGALIDPALANGLGVEIVVWNGSAAPDNFNQQLFGPAYQSVMQFP